MPPERWSRSQGRPAPMWSLSDAGACWASTPTRPMPEWQQLLSTKSMTRYLPPNGSALTARSAHSTPRRSPPPPDRINPSTSRTRRLRWNAHRRGVPGRVYGIGRRAAGEPRTVGSEPEAVKTPGPSAHGPRPRVARPPPWERFRPPAERGGERVRGVEVVVVREGGIVRGEEAMERRGVVGAEVPVAHACAEIEVLPVQARAQRERAPVPVLEPGAQVGVQEPELQLAVELATVEIPGEVGAPGERVTLAGVEVDRRAGREARGDQLARAVAPREVGRRQVVHDGAERDRVARHVKHTAVDARAERRDVFAGDRVRQALADELHRASPREVAAALARVRNPQRHVGAARHEQILRRDEQPLARIPLAVPPGGSARRGIVFRAVVEPVPGLQAAGAGRGRDGRAAD